MRICIAGKNSIAVYGLEKVLRILEKDSVLVCPNSSDDGKSCWQPSLRRFAKEWAIKEVSLPELYAFDDLIFISLEFDRIIKPAMFRTSELYNIHFSRLPAYKGVYTSTWPILNGEAESGVTLHRIDHGIDTGQIIDQIVFPINADDTSRSLYFKYLANAESLLDKNLQGMMNGNLKSSPQSAHGSTYYGKSSIDYRNLQLDTRQTAEIFVRQIRAFSFREFQVPVIDNFPVGTAEILNTRSTKAAGTINRLNHYKIVLSTIDYDVICFRDQSFLIFDFLEINNISGIREWISLGGNINITNKSGWSPLMTACYQGKINAVELLVTMGADPNQSNQNGTVPLMYAKDFCESIGDFSLCDILLQAGADTDKKDLFGKTAFEYAERKNQRGFIRYLQKRRSKK